MKFCFELERNNSEEFKVKKLVFNGNLDFLLTGFLYLVTTMTENVAMEMKDIINLLEGWEEEYNGEKCKNQCS